MVYNFRILNNQSNGGLNINPQPYKCKSENRNGHVKTIKRSRNDVTTIYIDQVTKACESLGVGHLEGEGRTLRHHPHLSTPTRIAEKNSSYFNSKIEQKNCNNKNILHQFKNLNMKCHQPQRLDIDIKNHSENNDTKKSNVKATEVTHEQCIKYEGNKRIKRKTIKTSEFNYTKTKTNIRNVDGFFRDRFEKRNEEITKNDWEKLNDLKTKRDQMPKYSQNNIKINLRLDENWLDSKMKLNKEFYTRESSESTYYKRNRSTETSQDETINTQSSGSLEKSTLSSVESNRSNSPKHSSNNNVTSSDISIDSPPIFIRKEQWPDIKCRMRILPKKETAPSPTAIIHIKNLEKDDNMHSSSSEQEWQFKSRQPTAKFKIRKTDEYHSSFQNEKLACKSPPSPTVMFRIKQPTFPDNKQKYSNTSENTISDETSTLSSISFQSSEDRIFTETRTNTENNNFYRTDSFSYIPQTEYKETSFEKDCSSEDYSTHSSKEEEIKYQKNPIEITFKIKSYEEESSKTHKNTEKTTHKEYLKQHANSKFSSNNSSMGTENSKRIFTHLNDENKNNKKFEKFSNDREIHYELKEGENSKRIFTHLNDENKNNKKFEKFSNDREIHYELKEGEIFETVRGTSEIIECLSGSKSHEIISESHDEKLKTDPNFTKFFTFNFVKSEPKFENSKPEPKFENSKYVKSFTSDSQKLESKYPNYLNRPHAGKSENENEKEIKNKFKPIRFNNLEIYDENFSFTKEVKLDKINHSHNDDKKVSERSGDKILIHMEKHPKTYKKIYTNYQEDSEFLLQKYSKLEERGYSEESNKSLTELNEYPDMKSYKSEPDVTKGITSYQTTSYRDIIHEKLNKQDKFSPSFHEKSNVLKLNSFQINHASEIPSRNYKKEIDKFTQTDKLENFKDKKKETLIINKYFNTETFKDITESSQIYSNLEMPKEKSDKDLCTNREEYPVNSIPKQPEAQEKHDTKELQDKNVSSKSNKDENLIINTLEVNRDHKIYSLENLPKKHHKNNKSMASLCNNIEWHSINRKKDNKFLTSIYDRNFTTEILTKEDTFNQSKYSNLNLEENKSENDSSSLKNSKEKHNDRSYFYANTIKKTENESISSQSNIYINKKRFTHEIPTHPEPSKVLATAGFHNEVRDQPMEQRKQTFKFEIYKNLQEKKQEKDEGIVKEICSVQAQLSHKGFRIKNWKEEVIIHRMLFTSVNRRELSLHDVTKPKNVITEKCFYVDDVRDVTDTYKFTIFKNETTGRILKFDSDFRNKSWDIFSTRNVKKDIKTNKIVTTKKATSLYVVWIPNYKKSFPNRNFVEVTSIFDIEHLSSRHHENSVWASALKESKSSAVSALLKSEWPTGGCSMSQEEKVPTPVSLVQPLTSFNLSCIQNSSKTSSNLPPTIITSLNLPITVHSAKTKNGIFRLDTPTKVLQSHQRVHQSLPKLCYHEQVSFSESCVISYNEKPTILRALCVRTDNCFVNDCIVVRKEIDTARTQKKIPTLPKIGKAVKVFEPINCRAVFNSENVICWFYPEKGALPKYEIFNYLRGLTITTINCEISLSVVSLTRPNAVELNGQYCFDAAEYSINSIKFETPVFFTDVIITEIKCQEIQVENNKSCLRAIDSKKLFIRRNDCIKLTSIRQKNHLHAENPSIKNETIIYGTNNLLSEELLYTKFLKYKYQSNTINNNQQNLNYFKLLDVISNKSSSITKYPRKKWQEYFEQSIQHKQNLVKYSSSIEKTDNFLCCRRSFLNYTFLPEEKLKEFFIPRLSLNEPKIKYHYPLQSCILVTNPVRDLSIIMFKTPQIKVSYPSCKYMTSNSILVNVRYSENPININFSSENKQLTLGKQLLDVGNISYHFQELLEHLFVQIHTVEESYISHLNNNNPQTLEWIQTDFIESITKEEGITDEFTNIFTVSSINKVNLDCKFKEGNHLQIHSCNFSYPLKILVNEIPVRILAFNCETNRIFKNNSLKVSSSLYDYQCIKSNEKKVENVIISTDFNNKSSYRLTKLKYFPTTHFDLLYHSSVELRKGQYSLQIFHTSTPKQILAIKNFETDLLKTVNKNDCFYDQSITLFFPSSPKVIFSDMKYETSLLHSICKYISCVNNSLRMFSVSPPQTDKILCKIEPLRLNELNTRIVVPQDSIKFFVCNLQHNSLQIKHETIFYKNITTDYVYANNSLKMLKYPSLIYQFPKCQMNLAHHTLRSSFLFEDQIKLFNILPPSVKRIENHFHCFRPVHKSIDYLQDTLKLNLAIVPAQLIQCKSEYETQQCICVHDIDVIFPLNVFVPVSLDKMKFLLNFEIEPYQRISVISSLSNESIQIFNIFPSCKPVNAISQTNLLQQMCVHKVYFQNAVNVFSVSPRLYNKLRVCYDVPLNYIDIHSVFTNHPLKIFEISPRISRRSKLKFETDLLQTVQKCCLFFEHSLQAVIFHPLIAEKISVGEADLHQSIRIDSTHVYNNINTFSASDNLNERLQQINHKILLNHYTYSNSTNFYESVNIFAVSSPKFIKASKKYEFDLLQYVFKRISPLHYALNAYSVSPLQTARFVNMDKFTSSQDTDIQFKKHLSPISNNCEEILLVKQTELSSLDYICTNCIFGQDSIQILSSSISPENVLEPKFDVLIYVNKYFNNANFSLNVFPISKFSTQVAKYVIENRLMQEICMREANINDGIKFFTYSCNLEQVQLTNEITPLKTIRTDVITENHTVSVFVPSHPREQKLTSVYEILLESINICKCSIQHSIGLFQISPISSENATKIFLNDLCKHIWISTNHIEENIKLFKTSLPLKEEFSKINKNIQVQKYICNQEVSLHNVLQTFVHDIPNERKIYPNFEDRLSYVHKIICIPEESLKVFRIRSVPTMVFANISYESYLFKQISKIVPLPKCFSWFNNRHEYEILQTKYRLLKSMWTDSDYVLPTNENLTFSRQLEITLNSKFEEGLMEHIFKSYFSLNDPLNIFFAAVQKREDVAAVFAENALIQQICTSTIQPLEDISIFSVSPPEQKFLEINWEDRLLKRVSIHCIISNYPLETFIPSSLEAFVEVNYETRMHICKDVIFTNYPLKTFTSSVLTKEKYSNILQETDSQVKMDVQQLCDSINILSVRPLPVVHSVHYKEVIPLEKHITKYYISIKHPLKILIPSLPKIQKFHPVLDTNLPLIYNQHSSEYPLQLFTLSFYPKEKYLRTIFEIRKNTLNTYVSNCDYAIKIFNTIKPLKMNTNYENILLESICETYNFINYPLNIFKISMLDKEKYSEIIQETDSRIKMEIQQLYDSVNIFPVCPFPVRHSVHSKKVMQLAEHISKSFFSINHSLKILITTPPKIQKLHCMLDTNLHLIYDQNSFEYPLQLISDASYPKENYLQSVSEIRKIDNSLNNYVINSDYALKMFNTIKSFKIETIDNYENILLESICETYNFINYPLKISTISLLAKEKYLEIIQETDSHIKMEVQQLSDSINIFPVWSLPVVYSVHNKEMVQTEEHISKYSVSINRPLKTLISLPPKYQKLHCMLDTNLPLIYNQHSFEYSMQLFSEASNQKENYLQSIFKIQKIDSILNNHVTNSAHALKVFNAIKPLEMDTNYENILSESIQETCNFINYPLEIFTISLLDKEKFSKIVQKIDLEIKTEIPQLYDSINILSVCPLPVIYSMPNMEMIKLAKYISKYSVSINWPLKMLTSPPPKIQKLHPMLDTNLSLIYNHHSLEYALQLFSVASNPKEKYLQSISEIRMIDSSLNSYVINYDYALKIFNAIKPLNMDTNYENILLESICKTYNFINYPLKIFTISQLAKEKYSKILQETDSEIKTEVPQLYDSVNIFPVRSLPAVHSVYNKEVIQLAEHIRQYYVSINRPLKILIPPPPKNQKLHFVLDTNLPLIYKQQSFEYPLQLFSVSFNPKEKYLRSIFEIRKIDSTLNSYVTNFNHALKMFNVIKPLKMDINYENILLESICETSNFINHPLKVFNIPFFCRKQYLGFSLDTAHALLTNINNLNDTINIFDFNFSSEKCFLKIDYENRFLQNSWTQCVTVNYPLKIFNNNYQQTDNILNIKFETGLFQSINQSFYSLNYAFKTLPIINLLTNRFVHLHKVNESMKENYPHNSEIMLNQSCLLLKETSICEEPFKTDFVHIYCNFAEQSLQIYQTFLPFSKLKLKPEFETCKPVINKIFFPAMFPIQIFSIFPPNTANANIKATGNKLNECYVNSVFAYDSVNTLLADQIKEESQFNYEICPQPYISTLCTRTEYPFTTLKFFIPKETKIQYEMDSKFWNYICKYLEPVYDSISIFLFSPENTTDFYATNALLRNYSNETHPINIVKFSSPTVKDISWKEEYKVNLQKVSDYKSKNLSSFSIEIQPRRTIQINSGHVLITIPFFEESSEISSITPFMNISKENHSYHQLCSDKPHTNKSFFYSVRPEEKFVNIRYEIRPLLNVYTECVIFDHALKIFNVPRQQEMFLYSFEKYCNCHLPINHSVKYFWVSQFSSQMLSSLSNKHELCHEIFTHVNDMNYAVQLFSQKNLEETSVSVMYAPCYLKNASIQCNVLNYPLIMSSVPSFPDRLHIHYNLEITSFHVYKSFTIPYQPVSAFSLLPVQQEYVEFLRFTDFRHETDCLTETMSFSVIAFQENLQIKNESHLAHQVCTSDTIANQQLLKLFTVPPLTKSKIYPKFETIPLQYLFKTSLTAYDTTKVLSVPTATEIFKNIFKIDLLQELIISAPLIVENIKSFSVPTRKNKFITIKNIDCHLHNICKNSIPDLHWSIHVNPYEEFNLKRSQEFLTSKSNKSQYSCKLMFSSKLLPEYTNLQESCFSKESRNEIIPDNTSTIYNDINNKAEILKYSSTELKHFGEISPKNMLQELIVIKPSLYFFERNKSFPIFPLKEKGFSSVRFNQPLHSDWKNSISDLKQISVSSSQTEMIKFEPDISQYLCKITYLLNYQNENIFTSILTKNINFENSLVPYNCQNTEILKNGREHISNHSLIINNVTNELDENFKSSSKRNIDSYHIHVNDYSMKYDHLYTNKDYFSTIFLQPYLKYQLLYDISSNSSELFKFKEQKTIFDSSQFSESTLKTYFERTIDSNEMHAKQQIIDQCKLFNNNNSKQLSNSNEEFQLDFKNVNKFNRFLTIDELNDVILRFYFIIPGNYDTILQKISHELNKESISTAASQHKFQLSSRDFNILKSKYNRGKTDDYDDILKLYIRSLGQALSNSYQNRQQFLSTLRKKMLTTISTSSSNIIYQDRNLLKQNRTNYTKLESLRCLDMYKTSNLSKKYINKDENHKQLHSTRKWRINKNVKSNLLEMREKLNEKLYETFKNNNSSHIFAEFNTTVHLDDDIILKLYMRDYYKRLSKLCTFSLKKQVNTKKITFNSTPENKFRLSDTFNSFKSNNFCAKRDFFHNNTTSVNLNDTNIKKDIILPECLKISNEEGFNSMFLDKVMEERIKNLKEYILEYYNLQYHRRMMKMDLKNMLTSTDHNCIQRRYTDDYRYFLKDIIKSDERNARKTLYRESNYSEIIFQDIILKLYLRDHIRKMYESRIISSNRRLRFSTKERIIQQPQFLNAKKTEETIFGNYQSLRYIETDSRNSLMPYDFNSYNSTNYLSIDIEKQNNTCDIILKLYMRGYYKRLREQYKFSLKKLVNKKKITFNPTPENRFRNSDTSTSFKSYNFLKKRNFFHDNAPFINLNDTNVKKDIILPECSKIPTEGFNSMFRDKFMEERIKNLKEYILEYYNLQYHRQMKKTDLKKTLISRDHSCIRSQYTDDYGYFLKDIIKSDERNARKILYKESSLYSEIIFQDIILKLYLRDHIRKMYKSRNNSSDRLRFCRNVIQQLAQKTDETITDNYQSSECTETASGTSLMPYNFKSHNWTNQLSPDIQKQNDTYDVILKLYMIDYYERLKNKLRKINAMTNTSRYLIKSNMSGYQTNVKINNITKNLKNCSQQTIKRTDNTEFSELLETSTGNNLIINDIILTYYFLSHYPYINDTNKKRKQKKIKEKNSIDDQITVYKNFEELDDNKFQNLEISSKAPSVSKNVCKTRTVYERILETFSIISKRRVSKLKPRENSIFNNHFMIRTETEVNNERKKIFQYNEVISDDQKTISVSSHKIQYFPKIVDKRSTISAITKGGSDAQRHLMVPIVTQKENEVVGLKNEKKPVIHIKEKRLKAHFELNLMDTKFNKDGKEKISYIYETSV